MKIEEIEGIGPAYATKLRGAGVETIEELLARGSSPGGRRTLSSASGITDSLLLEWVNHADLMRLKGVGSEYADLLEEAGVDSPAELAHRNAANLTAAMERANESRKLVRRVPTEAMVSGWIAEARTLEPVVTH